MRINNNIMALNAHRQLAINQSNASKSMERLSSGMRINRAGDDAAGLAISEKMRGQIRGLKQAQRNAQDGISLIQTAEGALNEIHAILQRMRELAVQSATDTNTEVDRGEIQKEIDQLAAEITRIAETTEFNTQTLMDGTFAAKFHIGANEGQNVDLAINAMDAKTLGVAGNDGLTTEIVGRVTEGNLVGEDGDATHIEVGEYTVEKLAEKQDVGTVIGAQYVLRNENNEIVAVSADGKVYAAVGGSETLSENLAEVTLGTFVEWDMGDPIISGKIEVTAIADHSSGGKATINATATLAELDAESRIGSGEYKVYAQANHAGFHAAFGLVNVASGEVVAVSENGKDWTSLDKTLLFSTSSQLKDGDIVEISGGGGIDVSSQVAADKAITTINKALEDVSAERSKLGAMQNRLEHTIANLGTSAENLQAAESRIRDLDMAEEIMAFTKNNILQQAATAMLAQANMAPQSVLQLLG